jgi:hypothetical protein
MAGRAKQLEVNTSETRTPSEFSLAGSFPTRNLPIFTTMKVRDRDITLDGLMEEIEHYTGVAT